MKVITLSGLFYATFPSMSTLQCKKWIMFYLFQSGVRYMCIYMLILNTYICIYSDLHSWHVLIYSVKTHGVQHFCSLIYLLIFFFRLMSYDYTQKNVCTHSPQTYHYTSMSEWITAYSRGLVETVQCGEANKHKTWFLYFKLRFSGIWHCTICLPVFWRHQLPPSSTMRIKAACPMKRL